MKILYNFLINLTEATKRDFSVSANSKGINSSENRDKYKNKSHALRSRCNRAILRERGC